MLFEASWDEEPTVIDLAPLTCRIALNADYAVRQVGRYACSETQVVRAFRAVDAETQTELPAVCL